MSTQQADLWQINGYVEIEHELHCECSPDVFRVSTFGSLWLDEKVRASSEQEAISTAIDGRRWRSNIDKDCEVYFRTPPKVRNLSQEERDQEKLRAWNAGEPIKA